MQTLEQFSTLVHKIYEGATHPSAWPGIVAAIAQSLDAEKGLLLTPFLPGKGGVIFPFGITQDNIALWASHYQPLDIWTQRLVERNCMVEGKITLGQELVTDEELLQSVWYREFLVRMDLFQLITSTVFRGGGDLPLVACSFFRGIKAAPFAEEARQYLRLLLPHVSRALGVMFTLRDAELRVASSLHALDLVHSGIVLLDENGKVCFINAAARHMFNQRDGLRLENGRCALLLDEHESQMHLSGATQSALNIELCEVEHFAQAIRVRRPSGLADYTVQVSRLPENNPYQLGDVIPRAVVFLKDNARFAQLDTGLLKRAYGLTRTEVRAALALGDGGSMESVAGQLNITHGTLKTHVKRIYSKIGVNNRAALISLLLSLATG